MNRFEDLIVWQKSFSLSVEIYKLFKDCRDFGFKDQICRSALSIPSNIAEGFERDSNKEFIHFLQIAKASAGELRTQLMIASEINLISPEVGSQLIEQSKEISYMLNSLIQKRKSFK